MEAYCVLFVAVTVFILAYEYTKNNIWIQASFCLMALFGGFRYEVGVDYRSYVDIFYSVSNNLFEKLEPGYQFLIKFAAMLDGTPQFVFLMASCITCYFVYKFVDLECENKSLSTIIYMCLGPLYFSSFNAVRESMAVAIFLYALHYLDTDRKKCILLILIASLFHYSVLAVLLMMLAYRKGSSYLLYFSLFSIVSYVIVRSDILGKIILQYFPRYGSYVLRFRVVQMDLSYTIMLMLVVIILLLRKYLTEDKKEKYFYLLTIMGGLIIAGMSSPTLTIVFTRLISYCTPCLMVLFPAIGKGMKQKWIYNVILYFACASYYVFIVNTGKEMLPYRMNFVLFN